MKTERINVFDQTQRKIRCVSKSFDYLGDGNIFIEERLEIGAIYTLERVEIQPYGKMVHLQEIRDKYGFQDFLFEELQGHDLEVYKRNYDNWLREFLGEAWIIEYFAEGER